MECLLKKHTKNLTIDLQHVARSADLQIADPTCEECREEDSYTTENICELCY